MQENLSNDCHSANLYLHFLRFLLNGLSSPFVLMNLCLTPIKMDVNALPISFFFFFFNMEEMPNTFFRGHWGMHMTDLLSYKGKCALHMCEEPFSSTHAHFWGSSRGDTGEKKPLSEGW